MGQSQSRIGDDGEGERINSGVKVTQELLEHLSGRTRSRFPRPSITSGSQHRLEADAEVVLQLDPKLQNALIQSQRVGDLLLKSEEKALAQVDKLADDLLEQEYRPPLKEQPCLAAREACLECYKNNIKDASKCAEVVHAYAECARQAVARLGTT